MGRHYLFDKKRRSISYFFEHMMQCLLSPLDNASASPGCESIALKCDGGFDFSANTKEVPEIDIPSCDLLPVIMSTEHCY